MFSMLRKQFLSVTQFFLLALGASQALAGQVPLAWNAPSTNTDGSPATNLAGYKLYWRNSAGSSQSVNVGNQTSYTLTGLADGAVFTLEVTAYNTAGQESNASNSLTVAVPHALPDSALTLVNTPVTIDVLANDTDAAGYPLTLTTFTQGAHGTVSLSGTALLYTPAPNFVGTDSFTYTVKNSQGVLTSATVTVTTTASNHDPIALSDTVSTAFGTPVSIAVLSNDSDPDGNPLTLTAVTQGSHGSVTRNGSTVTYTPNAGFVGTDTFTYTITDSQGASTTGTVTVKVFVMVPLEAESGTLSTPMTVGTDSTTPGLQYVWVPETTPSNLDPVQNGGYARYSFTVPKTDAYVVWGRLRPPTTGTGSFFLGLDVQGNGLVQSITPTTYKPATIHLGDRPYIDSSATITALPAALDGLVAIKTANADKKKSSATFLSFTTLQDATLYVAYDARVATFPAWLTASFTNTGQIIRTSSGPLAVWKKSVAAGPVTLPGNRYQTSLTVRLQYMVLLDFHGPEPFLVWDTTASSSSPVWQWEEAAHTSTPVFFLEAGSHTLTVKQRESGTKLDKLLLTNDLELVPQN